MRERYVDFWVVLPFMIVFGMGLAVVKQRFDLSIWQVLILDVVVVTIVIKSLGLRLKI